MMRGAGSLAVLRLLSDGEKYGYQLAKMLEEDSDGVLDMGHGTLYPTLYNLRSKSLITSRIDNSSARSRRYYRLTEKGKGRLERETKQWVALTIAMKKLGVTA
jgi:DNA-binding PadR family transcriptional regulator